MNRNKYAFLSVVSLMILLLPTLSVSLAQDETILFEDNFENGERSEWSYGRTPHELIEVEGNHVNHMQIDSNESANIEIITQDGSSWEWTDYAIEARIKIISVDRNADAPQFFVGLRNSPDGQNSYSAWLRFTENSSHGGLGGNLNGNFRGISGVEENGIGPQLDTWHTVRFQANANEITWYLDDQVIIRAIDDKVRGGGPSFGLAPNLELYLDDVRVYQLESQEPLVDERFVDQDCTIPEPGNASAFTINMPAGVNVRSLATDDFGLVTSLPQLNNVKIIGWFDTNGTPFADIAEGTWLVLHDGNYAVKASLVSIAAAALADVPQYQYIDSAFVAPEIDESEVDTSNHFEVTYVDFCRGELSMTTQTVEINTETVMPVSFGLVNAGEYEGVDAANRYSSVLSGIFVRSWEEGSQPGSWNLIIAFPTKTGKWGYVYVHASGDFSLHPVDANLQSTDPPGEFYLFNVSTRINTNAILAERTIRTGDHVILYFGEYTTNMEGVPNTQKGCNDLATTSDAIAFVIKGGTCKQFYQPTKDGWVSTYLRGLMFLND